MTTKAKNGNAPTRRGRGREKQPGVLASAVITQNDTNIIAEDLYNEPSRKRLDAGQVWVRMFDRDSSFLLNLMAISNYSPTLRRILSDKADMVVGDGFIPHRGRANILLTAMQKTREMLTADDPELEDLEPFLHNINLHQESLADVLHRIAYEYDAFGNAVVEIVRGRTGSEPFCYLYHVPLYMVGVRTAGPDQLVESIGIYDQWDQMDLNTPTEAAPAGFREVPLYPVWSEADEDGTQRTAIHLKQYAAGFFYWGLPEWISAQFWAEIEYRIPRFNITKFQNGFTPSAIVQFYGSMSPDEAKEMINKFTEKFTDTGNNHKIFAQVLRDEKLKANVEPLSERHDGEFLELQQMATQAIVTANRWMMSLSGLATAGQLGNNQQIRNETEYVQNTVIKKRQNLFLSRIVNVYMAEAGIWLSAPWADVRLSISNSMPISFIGDLDPEKALLLNEKREVMGYEPLDEAGMMQFRDEQTKQADNGNNADTTERGN